MSLLRGFFGEVYDNYVPTVAYVTMLIDRDVNFYTTFEGQTMATLVSSADELGEIESDEGVDHGKAMLRHLEDEKQVVGLTTAHITATLLQIGCQYVKTMIFG